MYGETVLDFILTPIHYLHKAIDRLLCTATMRCVLHVGPVDTPGGMSKVIQILADNPPDGWAAETLDSHSTGNVFAKIRAWYRARKFIKNNTNKYDIIHFHSAADFSFRRKLNLLKNIANSKSSTVFHIHSGALNRTKSYSKKLANTNVVTLSQTWAENYQLAIGSSTPMINPVDPKITPGTRRIEGQFLLLGRPDPVKGHRFAIDLITKMNKIGRECQLFATGIDGKFAHTNSLGWIEDEEKIELLQTSQALLVPSKFEGQPLVILEAMAADCPVVASSNIPDLPDCVTSAEFENQKDWLRAVAEVKTAGLSNAVEPHRIDNVRASWKRFYETIIDSKASTE